jgi:hypothetical protein
MSISRNGWTAEWLASCPDHLTPRERVPATHWIAGWVSNRTCPGNMEKRKFLTLEGLEI